MGPSLMIGWGTRSLDPTLSTCPVSFSLVTSMIRFLFCNLSGEQVWANNLLLLIITIKFLLLIVLVLACADWHLCLYDGLGYFLFQSFFF